MKYLLIWAVFLVLFVEEVRTGHGNDADLNVAGRQLGAGLHGETNFGTRGEKHDFGFTGAGRRFGGNISAAGDRVGIHFVTIEERNVLAREHEAGRAVAALDGARPGDDRLDRVGGTPDMHAGDEAQTKEAEAMLDDTVDIVIGNNKKHELLSRLEAYENDHGKCGNVIDINHEKQEYEEMFLERTAEHTRPYI